MTMKRREFLTTGIALGLVSSAVALTAQEGPRGLPLPALRVADGVLPFRRKSRRRHLSSSHLACIPTGSR